MASADHEAKRTLEQIKDIAESPVERARAMPPAMYTNEAIYRLEQEQLFTTSWICLGRADAISDPGDYLTFTIAEQPVTAIRQRDAPKSESCALLISNVMR